MTTESVTTPGYRTLVPECAEGASRFMGHIKRTGMKWITVHKDLQLWTVDGGAGATYTADTGTDGQQQHPTLTFAAATADDIAFIRDTVPTDAKPGGTVYLILKWYTADHDPTHTVKWDGTMRRIPFGDSYKASSDNAANVVLDGAGTGLDVQTYYCDDTTTEIVSSIFKLDKVDLYPLDTVQVQLFMDESACTVANDVVLVDSCFLYER